MADIKKQCKDCEYWLSVNGMRHHNEMHFCHHLLKTGKRRVEVNGVCKSQSRKGGEING